MPASLPAASLPNTPLRLEFRRIHGHLPNAAALFQQLFGQEEAQVWLDTSQTNHTHQLGHTAQPSPHISILAGSGGPHCRIHFGNARSSTNIFHTLSPHHCPIEIPEDWPHQFALGWLGAIGYEARHHAAGAPPANSPHRSDLPDSAMLFTDRAVVIDHRGWVDIAVLVETTAPTTSTAPTSHSPNLEWLRRAQNLTAQHLTAQPAEPSTPAEPTTPPTPLHFTFDHSKTSYLAAIASAQQAIAAGDTYEVCLTTTATGPALQNPFATYLQLRRTSPVPYGAYLHFQAHNLSILSASPERFLKLTPEGTVSAKPIKGTRPRAATPTTDAAIARELAQHPKDRAENLMIVDLLRNDLGRVCQPGSIAVPSLFAVETYSHVHQLVSTITGHLTPGATSTDLLAATFPGGSMTGAPKLATMDIIDQLEHRPRGFYSGAIGWLSPNNAAELSITIRTVVDDGRYSSFGVGGAIIADSDPAEEYAEILTKAAAILEALHSTVS